MGGKLDMGLQCNMTEERSMQFSKVMEDEDGCHAVQLMWYHTQTCHSNLCTLAPKKLLI